LGRYKHARARRARARARARDYDSVIHSYYINFTVGVFFPWRAPAAAGALSTAMDIDDQPGPRGEQLSEARFQPGESCT
jgi:hypothetical protein